jgi:hypothetical protein
MVLLMKTTAAHFIDSSNFYHSLKADNRLPFNAEHFGMLFQQLSDKFELKHIYFYDALKDRIKDPEAMRGSRGSIQASPSSPCRLR